MSVTHLEIVLTDDDLDDCIFFKDALDELPFEVNLTAMHNGEELLKYLEEKQRLPDVLFIDFNMPRKNGHECLSQIKQHEKLKEIPVVIYSTSFEPGAADLLFKNGAHFYIRKPGEFSALKKVIHYVLRLIVKNGTTQPSRENFIITTGIINKCEQIKNHPL